MLLPILLTLSFVPGPGRGAGFKVEIDEPTASTREVGTELIEIRGRAGSAAGVRHDLVIAIDISDSVLHDTGVDVDGDGPEGRTDPALLTDLARHPAIRPHTLRLLGEKRDFDDTILASEIEAAKALIERLDPRRFRVGIVTFSDAVRLAAPVGSSREELLAALDTIRVDFPHGLGGTDFSKAIDGSVMALRPGLRGQHGTRDGYERRLGIVFLSDGAPTLPVHSTRAHDRAIESAAVAGLANVQLYAFALGRDGAEAIPLLERMTELSGGTAESIVRPAELIARLRNLDLARIESLTVRNETTDQPARALRLFPDGSFDGLLGLAPGRNLLRVEARSEDGEDSSAERAVVYDAGTDSNEDDRRRLLEALRRRSEELELWRQMEERRRIQKRELEMKVLPGPDQAQ